MLEVPPASISPKSNLTQTHEHTYTHTLELTPYNIAYAGPPDCSNIWRQAKAGAHQATNQQQLSVVRRIAGHNSSPCQLLCGIFSSPCYSFSYFLGDNFLKYVTLQVHVIQPQKAELLCKRFRIEKNVGFPLISNYWSKSITLSIVSSAFNTTSRVFM